MTTAQASESFLEQADPYRRELLAHCYRMLGSVHDAEDLVQETYIRAWRSYDKFENRSSLRTWLYRIATNVCLTALDGRDRRPLPAGLGNPDADPRDPLDERPEVRWLEPIPDAMAGFDESTADTTTLVTSKESLRLALVAALQHLPPRQRAVLVLRDVLKWKAAEVAELLETSTAAVNSILQRARAQLTEIHPTEETVEEPTAADQRELLDKYVSAFEAKDVQAIVSLFTQDAVFDMPPYAVWYRGPENIAHHLTHTCPVGPGEMRLIPTTANGGQPAFGTYWRHPQDGIYHPFNLVVLTITKAGITHSTSFFDHTLFPKFGLPTDPT